MKLLDLKKGSQVLDPVEVLRKGDDIVLTTKEVAEKTHMTVSGARSHMKDLFDKGEVSRCLYKFEGSVSREYLYYLPENEEKVLKTLNGE